MAKWLLLVAAWLLVTALLAEAASPDRLAAIKERVNQIKSGRGADVDEEDRPVPAASTAAPLYMICLGTQKGGTTALAGMLTGLEWLDAVRHEVHFFDRYTPANNGDITTQFGPALMADYAKIWRSNKPVRFEKTPRYIRDYPVAYRIRDTLPDSLNPKALKFLVMLRDPVSRTYSGIGHTAVVMRRLGRKNFASTEAVVEQEITTVVECGAHLHFEQSPDGRFECGAPVEQRWRSWRQCEDRTHRLPDYPASDSIGIRGMYADELKNYLCAGFKPEQFLFIMNHELAVDPSSVVARMARFAGVSLSDADRRRINSLAPNDSPSRRSAGQQRPGEDDLARLFEQDARDLYSLFLNYDFQVDLAAFRKEFRHWSFQ